jgi:hypothetical protein
MDTSVSFPMVPAPTTNPKWASVAVITGLGLAGALAGGVMLNRRDVLAHDKGSNGPGGCGRCTGASPSRRTVDRTPPGPGRRPAELARTLDLFKVPERERAEVLGAFAAHKDDVTEVTWRRCLDDHTEEGSARLGDLQRALLLVGGPAQAQAAWTVVPSPNEPGSNYLYSIDATDAGHVWAVGRAFPINATSYHSLLLRYDGTAWRPAP